MISVLSLMWRRGRTIQEVSRGETAAGPTTFIVWTGRDTQGLKSALKVCMAILFEVRDLVDEQDHHMDTPHKLVLNTIDLGSWHYLNSVEHSYLLLLCIAKTLLYNVQIHPSCLCLSLYNTHGMGFSARVQVG